MVASLSVAVVIPAFNEAPSIGQVVKAVRALQTANGAAMISQIIVCDNASTDDTARLAAAEGASVVHEPQPGYGAACLCAIAALQPCDVVVFIDGDASVDVSELPQLLSGIEGGADLVIGARTTVAKGAMSPPQRFGNWLASALIRGLWRVNVTDLGPFRAIRREALQKLDMQDRAFGWTVEMQVKAIQQGLAMVEVPVSSRVRIGQSKISGTVRGVIGAGWGILSTIGLLWLKGWRKEGRG